MASIVKIFKYGIKYLKGNLDVFKFKQHWRNNNAHNYTCKANKFPDVVKVGNQTYGNVNVQYFGNEKEYLKIGHYCSIADDVVFLTGGNHILSAFSTFPFDAYYNTGRSYQAPTKGSIIVGDDVWIGYRSTILSGVTIGQGAVIGACSVVTKDVPPYAIFVGNKVIKYRYPQNIIDKMVKFDFSKLTPDDITKNSYLLDKDVDESFFETDFYKNHLKE